MSRDQVFKRILLFFALLVCIQIVFPVHRKNSEGDREPAQFTTIQQNAEYFASTIYRTAVKIGKLPVNLALPVIVRYKIEDYIKDLPIPADVRSRIHQRLKRDDFVDAVIPFTWALKEQYTLPKNFAEEHSFESYIKQKYSLKQNIPGLRHTLFDWGVPFDSAQKTDIPDLSLQKADIGRMVELYDALFLRSPGTNIFESKTLSPEAIATAKPILQKLLQGFIDKMPDSSEMKMSLKHLAEQDDQIEAIVISAATFLRNMVQKNYHAFSSLVYRKEDLKAWLRGEYEKQDFGKLYGYLLHMNQGRRFAAQVVVDGLQGGLMRSLTTAKRKDPFLSQILSDKDSWKKEIEALKFPVNSIEPTRDHFLSAVVRGDYRVSDPNYLPFFKSLYLGNSAYVSDQGISTTPTISVRNLPIAKTGADVEGEGGTGIPNFHFVDRKDRRAYYFFGNDALLLEDMAKTRGLTMMPERLKQFNSLNCSAQYDWGVRQSLDALLNLIIGEKSRDFGELLCFAELKRRAKVERELFELRTKIMANIQEGRGITWSFRSGPTSDMIDQVAELTEDGMPEYLLTYNPWPDHFAHFKGPFSDEILSPTGELNRLDYWLGRYASAYEEAKISKRTLWAMAGDHGLSPVYYHLNLEKFLFEGMRKDGLDLKLKKISSDEGGPPLINHPTRYERVKDVDVVVASTAGGNYMIDLFNDPTSPSWFEQPDEADLKQWRTITGRSADIVEEIRSRLGETLDYMAFRKFRPVGNPVEKAGTVLISTRKGRKVREEILRNKDRYFYQGSEDDLLEIRRVPRYRSRTAGELARKARLTAKCLDAARREEVETWCTRAEWMDLTAMTDRPDSVVQLARLFDEDRAGTINLFPRNGFGYNTMVPGRHAGEHFHEKDAFVAFWGAPGLARVRNTYGQSRRPFVNGSIAPTLYDYMTGDRPVVGTKGWGFPSMLSKPEE